MYYMWFNLNFFNLILEFGIRVDSINYISFIVFGSVVVEEEIIVVGDKIIIVRKVIFNWNRWFLWYCFLVLDFVYYYLFEYFEVWIVKIVVNWFFKVKFVFYLD